MHQLLTLIDLNASITEHKKISIPLSENALEN
jgi:hypothetical protein